MGRFWKDNSLSIVLLALFLAFWVGQALTGWRQAGEERREHGAPAEPLSEYLASGDFWEASAENWESEFLQMAAFVLLTVFLKQKGSPESKPPDGDPDLDRDPSPRPGAPWPVRRGGVALRVYQRSLFLALFGLFLVSFAVHAAAGARAYSEEALRHGGAPVGALAYLGTSRFWFESFQNWQSEFLSVGMLVLLGVWLRQRGSPESKPVDAPHAENEA
ncbi:DUF6766 family protein [Anaeromyxobacter dehalogenans]|uniref:Transmembrane protein n=1 Tax=Anaeromyxobacter dehalogenans (strain 2CP-C) TaxID=290397 RepID=Q2IFB6_ANADE|nr:DUF6766 family protein [Anaeromyxobacter dehalogenans]ABC83273.1 conserved hypothetical protein [Anaeromyxobacter dehalogenans 2CP-C]